MKKLNTLDESKVFYDDSCEFSEKVYHVKFNEKSKNKYWKEINECTHLMYSYIIFMIKGSDIHEIITNIKKVL